MPVVARTGTSGTTGSPSVLVTGIGVPEVSMSTEQDLVARRRARVRIRRQPDRVGQGRAVRTARSFTGATTSAILTATGCQRYATDGQHAYCAQQYAPNAWHGYPVDWQEVPPRVVAEWVAAGKVSRRTIRQARRRSGR